MNKKQATRTLGSIKTKQVKQPKQPQQTKKELNKDLEIESDDDDNIELSSFNEVEPEVKPRKKRIITEEQKKVLVERLAYARSMRKSIGK